MNSKRNDNADTECSFENMKPNTLYTVIYGLSMSVVFKDDTGVLVCVQDEEDNENLGIWPSKDGTTYDGKEFTLYNGKVELFN